MNVKRFFASSMQEVLKQVRDELGPDAVILSNNRVEGGMEVVAALDYEEEVAEQEFFESVKDQGQPTPSQLARMHAERHLQLQQEMEKARRRIESVKNSQAFKPNPSSRPSELAKEQNLSNPSDKAWNELSDMRSEIMELKTLISGSQGANGPLSAQASLSLVQEQIKRSLDSLRLSQPLINALVKRVASEIDFESAWTRVRQELSSKINADYSDVVDRGGVVALVGPTGSGKTMTIGKMAARYVMKYGTESIALVTTDRYRIAAHEQLKVFGRILNVPVHVVDDANPLDSVLDKLTDKKLVLLDTAGLMYTDSCWSEQLQEIKLSRHQIQPYLVVSAVGQYQVMCTSYQYYKIAGLAGVIVSKIDEAVSLGEVISFLIDTGLRTAYYTDGQRVPEDLHLLKPAELLDKAEGLLNSSERWVTITTPENEAPSESFYFHSA